LYAEQNRARMAELNVEIERLQHEINERQAKGKPTQDLEKRLEELESEKHDLVERIEALWSA
jgi:TolA-binding protein